MIKRMADEIERGRRKIDREHVKGDMNLDATESNYREENRFESSEASRTVVKREDAAVDGIARSIR
jgi:hypothetical protein